MITELILSNFRSLGPEVRVDLGGLTALVGPNGAGKSNVVDGLRFLSECMTLGLEAAITKRHGIGAVRRWSSGHPFDMSVSVRIADEEFLASYSFTLGGAKTEEYEIKSERGEVARGGETHAFEISAGKWEGPPGLNPFVSKLNLALPLISGDERFRPLADALRNVAVYAIYPDTLREPQKYDPSKPMNEHGANWLSVLKDQPHDTWKPELVAALAKLTGDIEDIRLVPAGGYWLVQFKHGAESHKTRPKWFASAQESDGTLRFAGILTALLQDPALPLIGIEEPELTIHPGALPLLHDFMRQASERSQIVFTTHSPELLDLVDPDCVRVVERRHGATAVARMHPAQRESVKNGLLSLGEVLRTEGIQHELSLEG